MDLSRRDMLGQIALALEHAHHAVQTKPGFSVLTPEMASKIEALTSAIIPSDDGPGAREAGVVYFIDRALATFDAGKLEEYRAGLAAGDDIAAIEKTLSAANLGVNPSNDGQVIRLAFPALTEERRKEYVKVVKNIAEEGRVGVRNARRDARKTLETAEKDGDISKDELERAEKDLEKMTQEHVEAIDKATAKKEQEVMEV